MLETKSPIAKIGGYILLGFFTLIIVISFGMPDFLSRMNVGQNTAAVINGEKVSRMQYVQYSDRMLGQRRNNVSEDIQKQLLDRLIYERLQLQLSKKLGVQISDHRVKEEIRIMFRDQTGKFNDAMFKNYLERSMTNINSFYETMREYLVRQEMDMLLQSGVSATPDEIQYEQAFKKSEMQIRYCFISNEELAKRLGAKVEVTDAEVTAELNKNKNEVKDPKTDRARIQASLKSKKFEVEKAALATAVDSASSQNKPFDVAAALLGGQVKTSAVFNVGEPVREEGQNGRMLPLNEYDMFRADFFNLPMGIASRAIKAPEGLYVFTPVKRTINIAAPSQADADAIALQLVNEKSRMLQMAVVYPFVEKSKIIRNMNFKNEE